MADSRSSHLFRPEKARKFCVPRAYKRVVTVLLACLVFAYCAYLLIRPGIFGRVYPLFGVALYVTLIASQVFWVRRLWELGRRVISNRLWRRSIGTAGLIVYLLLLAYNLAGEETLKGSGLTLRVAVLEVPFKLWLLGSILGSMVAGLLWIIRRAMGAADWALKKWIIPRSAELVSPDRRRFLNQTAGVLTTAPFVAGVYGLFYGRLNLETTHQRIRLRRLPKNFEGFRIVQLSDIHINAFMSAEEIRKYVAITNQLKGDVVVLTGDYVTWEPAMQGTVVQALSGLKAPFGVFGCLGNHEIYTGTEDSITRLFAGAGIRILRQARIPVQIGSEALNFLGVDFQSLFGGRFDPSWPPSAYLHGVERLLMLESTNILLSHNPNTFDRAAELGIDLSLAGHTHGGQVTLEFIHPSLSPAQLLTPYVQGWFEKDEAQLYVNRGIGVLNFPVRVGARPEITVLELTGH